MANRKLLPVILFLLSFGFLSAQPALTISSGTGSTGGSVTLNISIVSPSGSQPAAVQWTVSYPASSVASVSASAGAPATTAGKSLSCAGTPGAYTCLLSAMNSNLIGNGIVATVTLNLSSGASSMTVGLVKAYGVTASGTLQTVAAGTGTVSIAPATSSLSSLSCTLPTASGTQTMANNSSATCSVALTSPGSGARSFILSSSSASLTVPPSVTVQAGASSASFTISSSALTSLTRSVTLTATGSGIAKTLTFTLSILVTGLSCTPSAIAAPAAPTVTCTVALSQTAPAAPVITISTNAANRMSMPASVTVPSGSASAKFSGTVGSADYFTVVVGASLSGVAQSTSFTIGMAPPKSLTCSPAVLKSGQSSSCNFTLAGPAPAGEALSVSTSSPKLSAPASTPVATGAMSGAFTVTALAGYSGPVLLTIKVIGGTATATISAADRAPKTGAVVVPHSLSCQPKLASAGTAVNCEVQLSGTSDGLSEVALSASDPSVHIPAGVIGRLGQSTISFQVVLDSALTTKDIAIQAIAAGSSIEERISVVGANRPLLLVPGKQFAAFGKKLLFQIKASAGALSARPLPKGAIFDAASGTFEWTPSPSQPGLFKVEFTATDAQGSAVSDGSIQTGSGAPALDSLQNAASGSTESVCSSGSLATVRGGWLAPGTRVTVNDAPVPVVAASATQVTFVCPSLKSGTQLKVAVETLSGRSNTLQTVLRDAALGIFTLDDSANGQAAAVIVNRNVVAMPRNHRLAAEPAQAGDMLQIPVTGMPASIDPNLLSLRIGDIEVPVTSVQEVAAGIVNIGIAVPNAAPLGSAVPLVIHYRSPHGELTASETATIAVEAGR